MTNERIGKNGAASAPATATADVRAYVERKVLEATAHLEGLTPAELEDIRAVLREQIASDPSLAELVRTATGATGRIPGASE